MMGSFETGNKLPFGPEGQPLTKTTLTCHTLGTLDLAAPHPEDIDLDDIVHGLSQACRWANQGAWYSVAQHSVEVCWLANKNGFPKGIQRSALMHDAHEAYVGDMSGGLKYMLGDALRPILEDLDAAIEARFSLTGLTRDYEQGVVKDLEDSIVEAEYKMLFLGAEPGTVGLSEPMLPEQAAVAFLKCANALGLHAGRMAA
jgi:hypothetical protein